RPKVVALAYFAGNDLYDAESFEQYEENPKAQKAEIPGWKIKKRFTRYETLYSFTLVQGALALWRNPERGMGQAASPASLPPADNGEVAWAFWGTPGRGRGQAAPPAPLPPADNGEDASLPLPSHPSFDRGMFTLPINGHALRFAFMPPYLNTLRFDRKEFESRQGWKITRSTLLDMKRICEEQGAQLVVL